MCLQFEDRFPPEVNVFDEKYMILEDQLPAPPCASVVFCDVDRSSGNFWELAFEAFAEFREIVRAGICFEEVTKYNPDYGTDKLIASSMDGKTNIVRALVGVGVDVNAERSHKTALCEAAYYGNTDIVQILVGNNANQNLLNLYSGLTPLIRAANQGHTEITQILVSNRADLNLTCEDGLTPLIHAAMDGFKKIVQILVDGRADLDSSSRTGRTPLMWAISEKHPKIAQILVDGGANLNLSDEWGLTSLMRASCYGNTEISQILVRRSACVNTITRDGETALSIAARYENANIISFLVDQNASLDTVNNDGDAVIACALAGGQMDNVTYLLSIGAPLGRTALVCAVFSENVEMVKLVLSLDNSLLKEKRCGKTAHDVAVEQELADIIDVLESSER